MVRSAKRVQRTMLRIAERAMKARLTQLGLDPSRRRFAAPQDEELAL